MFIIPLYIKNDICVCRIKFFSRLRAQINDFYYIYSGFLSLKIFSIFYINNEAKYVK